EDVIVDGRKVPRFQEVKDIVE
ncbi:MAG: hypothetical protein Q4F74_06675, partial [Synergistaceae bacterium]|nr:hypothetical protein [Synergistaceae bacterium]